MKYVILVILGVPFLLSCDNITQKEKLTTIKNKFSITEIDNSNNLLIHSANFTGGVIMDKTVEGRSNSFTPTTEEILIAEGIFKKCLYIDKVGSDGITIDTTKILEPMRYIRQYFGILDSSGQKIIGFNCFYRRVPHLMQGFDGEEYDGWKYKEFIMKDKGNLFFQIIINLETKDCSNFCVN
ncbi:hypothetical protein [Rufibacter latericius]|uniref:WG repeat-containing protein n=1 Tax=Rufibacter latericius TaxID=2487040 RepID=A0A3M9M9W1_9BACT|nr:hypothetical protein [Rufibacter latericius]RNI22349.1 hypothetical protein EFB08_19745 [Rufibacter latericius]